MEWHDLNILSSMNAPSSMVDGRANAAGTNSGSGSTSSGTDERLSSGYDAFAAIPPAVTNTGVPPQTLGPFHLGMSLQPVLPASGASGFFFAGTEPLFPYPEPTMDSQAQPGLLSYDASVWGYIGPGQEDSSAWCGVGSHGDVVPVSRRLASLSQGPYPTAGPECVDNPCNTLCPVPRPRVASDGGTGGGDHGIRLDHMGAGAPGHMHRPALDVGGRLLSLPTSDQAYAVPGFHYGPDCFNQSDLGADQARQTSRLPAYESRADYTWQHTTLSSLAASYGTSLDEQPHRCSDVVTGNSSTRSLQGKGKRKSTTGSRKLISPSRKSSRRRRMDPSSDQCPAELPITQMESQMFQFSTSQTRRRPFTEKRRLEVAEIRKKGACFTCRVQRITCGYPCITCHDRQQKNPGLSILCYRLDLKDCCVFRKASPLHRVQGRETMCWDRRDAGTRPLRVTMTGPIGKKPLVVECHHFQPVDTDRVDKNIGGSCPGEVWSIPPYAAMSFVEIRRSFEQDSIDWCDEFIGAMRDTPSQGVATFAGWLYLARQYAVYQPASLTHRALQLWTGAKLTQIERGLVGEDTLGVGRVQDETSALNGLVPIPPILDLQIDTVIIRWMTDLQEALMKDLFGVIRAKKRHCLLDMFLAIFVLASAAECVACEQREFAEEFRTSKEEGVYRYVKTWSDEMTAGLHWSVHHLIYTFRKGAEHIMPVGQRSLPKAADMAQLGEQETSHIKSILESLTASTSPIKMEYTTTAGVNTGLSWILPLLECC